MYGGADDKPNKPKKPVNATIRLMIHISKILNNSGNYPDIKQFEFMQISKLIVDDSKSKTWS